MKHLVKGSIILISAIVMVACSTSTKLTSSWKNKDEGTKQFEKIAVVAISPDQSNRYLIERALVKDLTAQNLKAVPTYEIFPFAGKMGEIISKSENPEALKERIKNKVTEQKIDALMIVALLDKEKEQRYVNNNNFYMGGTGYYGTPYMGTAAVGIGVPYAYGAYYNYYAYSVGTVYDAGYYVEDVTYFLECNLYDVAKEELLWSGRTKSVNIGSVEEEAVKFSDLIVKDLLAKKVIAP
ncbi:hypothetical protein MASR2M47_15530 [Draconibacterium sp.]|jgi:hypothetical protein